MLELGPIAFTAPAMLLALLLLPALWWLLRITPPLPRLVRFPPIRLLFGLKPKEETPASAPLWLILLRLAMATMLILGLARPVVNPGDGAGGDGALLLVIDDGWAAAASWNKRQEAMVDAIDRAGRSDQPVILLSTAPGDVGQPSTPTGLLRASEAKAIVGAMEPKPWSVDRTAAAAALDRLGAQRIGFVLWLSDGVHDPGVGVLAEKLRRIAELRIMTDPPAAVPLVLLPPPPGTADFAVTLRRASGGPEQTARVRLVAVDGRVLGGKTVTFESGVTEAGAAFDLPTELRNEAVRLEIENGLSAGAIALLDDRWRRRPVGLVASSPLDADLSLLDELYYIGRALAPYGEIQRGPLDQLLASNRAAIVLPDGQALVSTEVQALDRWIRDGGLLLRFAGNRLSENGDDGLVPVALRGGGRTLGGTLLWTEPSRLADFRNDSPYHGLKIPEDVRVARQVLAEPSLELNEKTWARLQDGTPLVTAERRGQGWLVLVHTTASPDWSNLALSGLFVEMLERTVAMSQGVTESTGGNRPLPPLELLDGYGRLTVPAPTATPIEAAGFADATPGPRTPPGYYGSEAERRALNLGPALETLRPLVLPAGVAAIPFADSSEVDLKPWLLALALLLLLADTLVTAAIRHLSGRIARRPAAAARATTAPVAVVVAAFGSILWNSGEAAAQASSDADAMALQATLSTRLAYVVTGDESLDSVSKAGLEGLTLVLNRRTAVEAAGPLGVDPNRDELAFFPLLYWPIGGGQPPLPPETATRLNRYLDNGGTILFDTRDGNFTGAGPGPGVQRLRNMANGLNIPGLQPIPVEHVLTKAFYLTQEFPGRWAGGQLWVEQGGESVNDGVSRIIVGGNDWASAWAVDAAGLPLYPAVPGGEAQREIAFRFGVNLVMYTLTGNYKSDQVHVPAILERLAICLRRSAALADSWFLVLGTVEDGKRGNTVSRAGICCVRWSRPSRTGRRLAKPVINA